MAEVMNALFKKTNIFYINVTITNFKIKEVITKYSVQLKGMENKQ